MIADATKSMKSDVLDAALDEASARFSSSNPKSREHQETAANVLPGGNTRSNLFHLPFPLVLCGGSGARVRSIDDGNYLDFLGDYTAGLYGHSDPTIAAAMREALENGVSLGGVSHLEERLASLICDRFQNVERVRFTNSGTEANLLAIGTARALTGRTHVVVFKGGYHGSMLAFGSRKSALNVPGDFLEGTFNELEDTQGLLDAHAKKIAAVLVEPMQGAAGCIPARPDFLRLLDQWCDRHGALFILDEVMTSRLAPGGLQQHFNVSPSLTTFGKYLGGGQNFGAFGGRASIMDHFDPRRSDALYHAGTFNNNVLTLAAGIAGLSRVFTPSAAQRLSEKGDRLRKRLNATAQDAGVAMQFTGFGSTMNAHFREGEIRNAGDLAGIDPRLSALLHFDLLEAGIWAAPRGMMNVSLPMGDADADSLVQAVGRFIDIRQELLR